MAMDGVCFADRPAEVVVVESGEGQPRGRRSGMAEMRRH